MPSNHLILCHPLSSHLQSFRVSGSFQMSQFFTSGEERIGVSALALVLPMNIQVWFPLGWTACLRDSQESSPTPHFKSINSPVLSFLYSLTLTSIYDYLVGEVMSLLLNMLSRLVITFLPRSKRLLITWLQSPSAVILEPRKIKSLTVSTVSPSICHEVMGPAIRWYKCIYMGRQYKWNDRWTYFYPQ